MNVRNQRGRMKKIIVVVLAIGLLASCGAKTEQKATKTAEPEVSASADASTPAQDQPGIIELDPTKFTDSSAPALFTLGDIKGFIVIKNADPSRTPAQSKADKRYNDCIGADAPSVAYVDPKNQLIGDSYGKDFSSLTRIFIESSVTPSQGKKTDLDYIANNPNFKKCLIDYITNSTEASNGAPSTDFTYKLISNENDVIVTQLKATSMPPLQDILITYITTFSSGHTIQYGVAATGNNKTVKEKSVDQIVSEIKALVVKKRELIK